MVIAWGWFANSLCCHLEQFRTPNPAYNAYINHISLKLLYIRICDRTVYVILKYRTTELNSTQQSLTEKVSDISEKLDF